MSHCTALGNTACLAVLGCFWKNGSGNSSHPNDELSDFDCEWQYVYRCMWKCFIPAYTHVIQYEGYTPDSNV